MSRPNGGGKTRLRKRRDCGKPRLMAMTAAAAGATGARSAAVAAARSRRRVGTRRSGRAHQAGNFFRSAFRTGRFRRRENERFKNRVATLALVFVNRHRASSLNLNKRKRTRSNERETNVPKNRGDKKRRLERSVAGSPSRRSSKSGFDANEGG